MTNMIQPQLAIMGAANIVQSSSQVTVICLSHLCCQASHKHTPPQSLWDRRCSRRCTGDRPDHRTEPGCTISACRPSAGAGLCCPLRLVLVPGDWICQSLPWPPAHCRQEGSPHLIPGVYYYNFNGDGILNTNLQLSEWCRKTFSKQNKIVT